MCPSGSLDLMKNSQRSEDLQAVSEQWHLLMVGLCPAPNGQGKGKACVTSLPNVGWLSLSLWQGGLRLVDQDGVHTSHEVLKPEIPTHPPASNQRGVPPTLRMCRCAWVGAPKPEAPPGAPTAGRVGGPGQHATVGWSVRLLPGWTPGLFQQRHVEQGGGKGSGGETEAGRGPALVSPSQVGQNPDIPVPCWGGCRVSGKELSKASMG